MPFALNKQVRIHWRRDGDLSKPALMLIGTAGTDKEVWQRTLPLLNEYFYVVRMDLRGHGVSDGSAQPSSFDDFVCDASAVAASAGLENAFVCGIGLGGLIAMGLCLADPDRWRGLIVASSSARPGHHPWEDWAGTARTVGMMAVADAGAREYFATSSGASSCDFVETFKSSALDTDPSGFVDCCVAMMDVDLEPRLPELTVPTLVLSAKRDRVLPFERHGSGLAAIVARARTVMLDAGHLACLEAPNGFASAIIGFAEDVLDNGQREKARQVIYDAGMKTRRKVQGDVWVDKSLANRTDFNRDYQEIITRFAWDEIWSRPGLDHKTRRLLVLAITASLGRWEEFRLHVRLGLDQNGFTVDDLKETLLHTALYAGVPAANTGFTEAGAILRERAAED